MGRLKRVTREELESDDTLYDVVLARLVGALEADLEGRVGQREGQEDGAPEAPLRKRGLPKPWEVCREMGFSYGGLLAWINADPTGRRMVKFRNAMEVRAQTLAEDALTIADTPTYDTDGTPLDTPVAVSRARLMVDTRFRLARAYSPSVFGQSEGVQQGVGITIVLSQEDRAA